MKRPLSILMSVSLCFLLSGCIKFDLALEINKDSTVSGTMIYAVSDALAGLGADTETSDPTSSLLDIKSKGVTTTDYKEGGFTGTKIVLDHVPLSAFDQPGGDSGEFKIIRDGNTITLKGALDLSSTDTSETSGSDWGDALAKSLFATADLNMSVKFPVKILSTTGQISEDGRTVSWKPKFGEKLDLTTTVELPTTNFKLIGLGAVGLLLILIGTAALVTKRRKSKSIEPQEESSIPIEKIEL
jgi:hypothetical protein